MRLAQFDRFMVFVMTVPFATMLSPVTADPLPVGRTFMRSYTVREFRGHDQVFAVAEDSAGIIYFSNRGAIIAFNGQRWRRATVPTTWIHELYVDTVDRVYVAGTDEFGWCQHDPVAGLTYHSLLDYLPPSQLPPGAIWSVTGEGRNVYFATSEHVYRWDETTLHDWSFEPCLRANVRHVARRTLLYRKDDGLFELRRNQWQQIPAANGLMDASRLVMLDQGEVGILLVTPDGTMPHLFRDNRLVIWTPPAAGPLRNAVVVSGTVLSDGALAFSTAREAVVLLNPSGTTTEHYNAASGFDPP